MGRWGWGPGRHCGNTLGGAGRCGAIGEPETKREGPRPLLDLQLGWQASECSNSEEKGWKGEVRAGNASFEAPEAAREGRGSQGRGSGAQLRVTGFSGC